MSVRTEMIDGAEVKVEEGTGTVLSLEAKTKNTQVTINADGLKFPLKAWAENVSEVANTARQAQETGGQVRYRIETHRDKDISKSLPIDEVEKTKKFRRLVALHLGDSQHQESGGPANQRKEIASSRPDVDGEHRSPGLTESELELFNQLADLTKRFRDLPDHLVGDRDEWLVHAKALRRLLLERVAVRASNLYGRWEQ